MSGAHPNHPRRRAFRTYPKTPSGERSLWPWLALFSKMKITNRNEHHAEVTEPGVYHTLAAGKLLDVMIELPDHMIDLTIGEARRMRDALNEALGNEPHPVAALEEIDREVSGALNNAAPEDAPEILAHVGGIAARALRGANA